MKVFFTFHAANWANFPSGYRIRPLIPLKTSDQVDRVWSFGNYNVDLFLLLIECFIKLDCYIYTSRKLELNANRQTDRWYRASAPILNRFCIAYEVTLDIHAPKKL